MDAKGDTLPLGPVLVLTIALGGMFLVRLSEQFVSTSIADLQGGAFATANEASWIPAAYTTATFAGIALAVPIIRTIGLGRYLAASYVVFALTAIGCAVTSNPGATLALRAIQGFAAGGFGPAAFVALFTIATGARLAFMGAILAFLLIFPTTLGPVVAGFVEDAFSGRSQLVIQAIVGTILATASIAFVPRQPPRWSAFSPVSILHPRLLVTRKFGIAIGLNFLMRATLVLISYLVPQFLLVAHGHGRLEISHLMLWAAIAQVISLPVTWWLLHRLDSRWIMSAGFVLCAVAAALLMNNTPLAVADRFRLALALFAVGQAFFLLPAIVVATRILKPPDLPTASLAFNMTTVGGTVLGSVLVPRFVATQARSEAWTLAFDDAFAILAIVLAAGALVVIAMGRSPPLASPDKWSRRPFRVTPL